MSDEGEAAIVAIVAAAVRIVLRAALDASHTHPDWVHAVAGYVAPAEDWDPLLAEWQDALTRWKMGRFHLSQLQNLVGREKAKQCEGYFARLIEDSAVHAIGAAILTKDWQQPDWGEDTTPRLASAYEQSLWLALKTLGQHCALEFPNKGVEVLCDVDAPESAISSVFELASAHYPCLRSLAISNSLKRKELQCADLAAGFLRRSWLNITAEEASELPWGVIPRANKGRTAIWSLHQSGIVARAIRMRLKQARAR